MKQAMPHLGADCCQEGVHCRQRRRRLTCVQAAAACAAAPPAGRLLLDALPRGGAAALRLAALEQQHVGRHIADERGHEGVALGRCRRLQAPCTIASSMCTGRCSHIWRHLPSACMQPCSTLRPAPSRRTPPVGCRTAVLPAFDDRYSLKARFLLYTLVSTKQAFAPAASCKESSECVVCGVQHPAAHTNCSPTVCPPWMQIG